MKKHILLLAAVLLLFSKCNQKETKIEAPEPNRFSKQVINNNLNEPIALAISNAGDVFYCERKGKVFMYEPKKGITTQITNLKVDDFAGNGIMGMCLDPDFDYNKRIYLFYIDTNTLYRLSRFVLSDGKIDLKSEKVVYSFQLDKEPGAHNGGTIAFDSKRNLVISTGDNTPPWQANGYPPHDQRVGREIYDAQRTASNTNDVRGKILRIKPLENGSYIIPDGNLFPKDGSKGKPEIFAMGCRNPWKMSIDPKTDYIYWGEVGPDAGTDSTIGPRGYDEINQAKKPGNFGWPYFIANTKPYRLVDLVSSTPGLFFDAKKPANESKNNTGQKYLPLPTNAFIYYPYAKSPEFPVVGKGGRTACAGPFYDFTKHKSSKVKFPAYYHNKFFIYEWMRDWIMAVSLDEKSNFVSIEPVMQNLSFAHPTHMAFAPDGSLYIIEYGFIWYNQSAEAKLSRVIYSDGNRPPKPKIMVSDSIFSKNQPIKFSGNKSYDFDGDSVSFQWYLNDTKLISTAKEFQYEFSTSGIYTIKLFVKDTKGAVANTTQKIIIGNTYPKISFEIADGNRSFYFPNQPLAYKVLVSDIEDKMIDSNKIKVTLNYMPDGNDIFPIMTQGHTDAPKEREITENKLIAASDCKSCHAMKAKSVGPSFIEISKRYSTDADAISKLATKIIKGGSGVWGGHAMSAHPQLSVSDAKSMVEYILSLNKSEEGRYTKIIPSEGVIPAEEFNKTKGWFYINASYTDTGADGKGILTSQNIMELKNSTISFLEADSMVKCQIVKGKGKLYLGAFQVESYAILKNIDLSNLSKVSVRLNSKEANGTLQIRVGTKNGKIIASIPVKAAGAWEVWSEESANIIPTKGLNTVFVTLLEISPNNANPNMINLDWIKFEKASATLSPK